MMLFVRATQNLLARVESFVSSDEQSRATSSPGAGLEWNNQIHSGINNPSLSEFFSS